MGPKKAAAAAAAAVAVADPPSPTEDAPVEENEHKNDAAAVRKLTTHPPTAIMVREALKELDSKKGVSSQAIQKYIHQKYPSVDVVRLKSLVRKALKKGIESGTLVRPANATVTTGATGKFRLAPLAPKNKESKAKAENVDPNVQKSAKDGAKGEAKKKKTDPKKKGTKEEKSSEVPKPAKKPKKSADEGATTKVAPAKKPKAKKSAETEGGDDSEVVKPKGKAKAAKEGKEKTVKNEQEKTGKASQSKSQAAKSDGDAPAKAQGKRRKKAAE